MSAVEKSNRGVELLEIKHLQMLRAISRNGRATDAAGDLGLTPSALSHRLREAERRLGVALFTRLHKRLRITPVGEYLLQVSERILTDLERAQSDAVRMGRNMRHCVRIAIETYSAYHWLPAFLQRTTHRTDDLDVQVMASARQQPLRSLLGRHIDLAIIEDGPTPAGIETLHLFDDEIVYIMPPNHQHASKPSIEAADLENETYITYALTPDPDREFARLMRPAEIYPRWATPMELPEAIIELVAAGLGTSALARWAVEGAIRSRRVSAARVTDTGISVRWLAALRSEDARSGPVRQLADALAAWCATDREGFRRISM